MSHLKISARSSKNIALKPWREENHWHEETAESMISGFWHIFFCFTLQYSSDSKLSFKNSFRLFPLLGNCHDRINLAALHAHNFQEKLCMWKVCRTRSAEETDVPLRWHPSPAQGYMETTRSSRKLWDLLHSAHSCHSKCALPSLVQANLTASSLVDIKFPPFSPEGKKKLHRNAGCNMQF